MKKKKTLIVIAILLISLILVSIILNFTVSKKSYAASSLYNRIQTEVTNNNRGASYTGDTNDCYTDSLYLADSSYCSSHSNTLYCRIKTETTTNSKGRVYINGSNDCYSKNTPNTPSYKYSVTAKFYYQSSSTHGTTSIKTATAECTISSNGCQVTIPSVVRSSVGTYNNSYAGLNTSTKTMTASVNKSATTVTITGDTTYYTIYSSTISNKYYSN